MTLKSSFEDQPDDKAVKAILDAAQHILVIQSDRPDGDSLASALFLEDVLGERGKTVSLYCGVTTPEYIRFLDGWDRVSKELPHNIDATICVDNASLVLLEKFNHSPESMFIKAKPFIVADHHESVKCDIPFATHNLTRSGYASAGEMLYELMNQFGYKISLNAKKYVMQSILSDTLGLTNDLASPKSYRIMADLIEAGVERSALEEARKALSKMNEPAFRLKASLIERTELYLDNALAICVIPEEESYSVGTSYNLGPLILGELLMVEGVRVAIALKTYHSRATAAIRCTYGTNIAHALAERFGGGGHPYSAGFRVEPYNQNLADLKRDIVSTASELLQ